MLTIYRWENGGLKETPDFGESCWINLVDPTTTELERVLTHSRVPRDFLTDPLDVDERPRFDYDDDDVRMLLVHVPCLDSTDEVIPYRTVPLGIILFGKSVITVCRAQTPVTTAFLDQIRRVASRSACSGTAEFCSCGTSRTSTSGRTPSRASYTSPSPTRSF